MQFIQCSGHCYGLISQGEEVLGGIEASVVYTIVTNCQVPILLTWLNFNASMDK